MEDAVMLIFTTPLGTMLAQVPDLETCQQLGLSLLAKATQDGIPAGFACAQPQPMETPNVPMG